MLHTNYRQLSLFTFTTAIVPIALGATACSGNTSGDFIPLGEAEIALNKAQRVAELRSVIASEAIVSLPPAPAVSPELFALGQALAFDKVLSGKQNISCMTCHHPTTGTGDRRSLPLGEGGSGLGQARMGGPIIPRNAPALFNLHTMPSMFWDSRVEETLGGLVTPAGSAITPAMEAIFEFGVVSAQAMFPVTSREEMRGDVGDNPVGDVANGDFTTIWSELMARLAAIPQYVTMFEAAYPGTPFCTMTFAHAANAIAGFEVAGFEMINSPWDQFVAGDDNALDLAQLKGAQEFFDSDCQSCHSGSTLSDFTHRNTGLVQFGPGKGAGSSGTDDFGREGVTGNAAERYAFRVPILSNVELTGPWGHDGQYESLEAFSKHYKNPEQSLSQYNIGQHVSESDLFALEEDNRDEIENSLDPATASPTANQQKIADFLRALTDDDARDLLDRIPASVPSGLPVGD